MPSVKLTKRVVESVKPGARSILLCDTEVKGFHCKITPTGRRIYSCYYRTTSGIERRPKIGTHGELTVDQARDIAREMLSQARRDLDPSQVRKYARTAPDVKSLGERYLAEYATQRHKPSYLRQQERMIETKINPELGSSKITTVTYDDIVTFHNKLRAAPYEANRVLAVLRGMFKHAILWGLRPDRHNPCQYVAKFHEWRRDRLLSDSEVLRLHHAMDDALREGSEPPNHVLAIKLLFATASRISEIISLEWSFLKWEFNEIRWPDSKTGHLVKPLSSEVKALLSDVERLKGVPWVLRSQADPKKPLSYQQVRQTFRRLCARAAVNAVTLHTIRHRCATDIANTPSIPIRVGMQLTGHKTVATFMGYVHTEKAAVFAAAETVAEKRIRLVAIGAPNSAAHEAPGGAKSGAAAEDFGHRPTGVAAAE